MLISRNALKYNTEIKYCIQGNVFLSVHGLCATGIPLRCYINSQNKTYVTQRPSLALYNEEKITFRANTAVSILAAFQYMAFILQ